MNAGRHSNAFFRHSGEMGQLGFPLLEDLPKDQDGYPYEPAAGLIKAGYAESHFGGTI